MDSRRIGPRNQSTAFWVVAVSIGVVMFAAAAPSPLYPVYQRLWGFSSAMLTVVFAVYVGALLVSLLTFGALADHIGRRPVIAGSMLALIAAMIVFATAGGVGALLLARVLQGLATGTAMGVLSAAIVDLQPSRRAGVLAASVAPIAGLASGVATSAVLVQYAPSPRRLVFGIAAAALALLVAATIAVMPETAARPGFSSRAQLARAMTPRVSVPREARTAFVAGVPALIATWALSGLNLSLGSSIIAQLGIGNHAVGGALLAGYFFAATAAAPLAGSGRPLLLPAGYAFLGAGLALQFAGSLARSVPGYAAGLFIAGAGFSIVYAGVIASLTHVPAHSRSRLFAAVYIVSYLAFSVPALVGGVAADAYGLGATTTGYTLFVLLMVGIAAARLRPRRRPAESAAHVSGSPDVYQV